eukprot:TRINITY_DN2616_c0_g1_i3.p2 TRINITY_DN2616_c0_g1~~TRINITY_DN2616_c0_g1_i3.p2  ORF type:complete len:250 (+),score=45.74 TRINITY_DN2616_c0_g1_i3:434-1183(+)
MKYYDIDHDGNISYEEFLRGLREPMNERRSSIVQKIFSMMDRDNSGKITVSDIEKIYVVTKHPDFIEKRKSKEEILGEFLSNFEGAKGNKDGIITKQEFFDYYNDLSMSISSDDYFVQMIESAWMMTECEEDLVYKERLDELIRAIRLKLLNLAPSQDEFMLRKLFKDFDLNQSGNLTVDELQAMMFKMGIAVERKYITGLFRRFDANKSGTIEFEEFCTFITTNPYTCLLYTSPSPRDLSTSRMPSSA